MPYPKRWMTITELNKEGLSREDLENWVHVKDFPAMRVGKRGTWRIDTSLLDAWLIKHGYMKHPNIDLIKITEAIQV